MNMPKKRDYAEGDNRHRSGHRHHKKSAFRILKHKIKKALRQKFWIIPTAILVVALIAGGAFWMLKGVQDVDNQSLRADDQRNVGSGYRDIVYKGKPYRYNNRITTVLYAGVDSRDPLVESEFYTMGNLADSINLVVLDEYKHKITIIPLNRNTMTKIRKYTLKGRDRGQFTEQLCYAFYYGNGGKASADNLCEAVSELLYGIPINEYVVTTLGSINQVGDIVGPIPVVVPNDDLEKYGYKAGQQIVVGSDNIDLFLHYRDTEGDFSNDGRMQRQMAYMDGSVNHMKSLIEEDPLAMWDKIQLMEQSMLTSITRNQYLDLVNTLKRVDYNSEDMYTPSGENMNTLLYDEFYPDEDALLSKVIEIFYLEK